MAAERGRDALPTIVERLRAAYPDARYELDWQDPLQRLVATSLAAPTIEPEYAGWSLLYSAIIALALGLVVRHIDLMFTGGSGRRARRSDEIEEQMRPEPGRTEPLR